MARCAIEIETLEGARMRCEITAGHPGAHMNGIRGLVPGNITWEWRPTEAKHMNDRDELLGRLSAGNSQAEKAQITHECVPECRPNSHIARPLEPERSDGRIEAGSAPPDPPDHDRDKLPRGV